MTCCWPWPVTGLSLACRWRVSGLCPQVEVGVARRLRTGGGDLSSHLDAALQVSVRRQHGARGQFYSSGFGLGYMIRLTAVPSHLDARHQWAVTSGRGGAGVLQRCLLTSATLSPPTPRPLSARPPLWAAASRKRAAGRASRCPSTRLSRSAGEEEEQEEGEGGEVRGEKVAAAAAATVLLPRRPHQPLDPPWPPRS